MTLKSGTPWPSLVSVDAFPNTVVDALIRSLFTAPLILPTASIKKQHANLKASKAVIDDRKKQERGFLSIASILDVLTELVNAFPSVAIAVHRFHHRHKRDLRGFQHAVAGCASPAGASSSATMVTYLLHKLLVLDRAVTQNELDHIESIGQGEGDVSMESSLLAHKAQTAVKRKEAREEARRVHMRQRVASTTARLLWLEQPSRSGRRRGNGTVWPFDLSMPQLWVLQLWHRVTIHGA